MAYTPTEWKNGDVITAEKLNKIEGGVANINSVFITNVTATKNGNDYNCVSDATFNELKNAYNNGNVIFVRLTVNENDGRPESYYTRETLHMTEYVSDNTFGFINFNGYRIDSLSISFTEEISFRTRTVSLE